MEIIGYVDHIENNVIMGWAKDAATDEPISVEFMVNGNLAGRAVASGYRDDLAKARIGKGRHAFSFTVPTQFCSPTPVRLEVRGEGSEQALEQGRQTVVLPAPEPLISADIVAQILKDGTWCPHILNIDKETLLLTGWAIPPALSARRIHFKANGIPFEHMKIKNATDDAAVLSRLSANVFAFECRLSLAGLKFDRNLIRIQMVDAETGQPFTDATDYFCMSSFEPEPDEESRWRVSGARGLAPFLREGATNFQKLQRSLQRYAGKSFRDFESVLDWGCGCGRLLRFLPHSMPRKVTGVDVDPLNLAWCRDHLSFGDYRFVGTMPPLPFPDGRFDLVYGISVLSHLAEDVQNAWLAELSRIVAPGGWVLQSIMGKQAFIRFPKHGRHSYATWQENGFWDEGVNDHITKVISDAEYYRNVFQTPEYVRSEWARYFDVVEIVPATIGNYQDLVIMRKRG